SKMSKINDVRCRTVIDDDQWVQSEHQSLLGSALDANHCYWSLCGQSPNRAGMGNRAYSLDLYPDVIRIYGSLATGRPLAIARLQNVVARTGRGVPGDRARWPPPPRGGRPWRTPRP